MYCKDIAGVLWSQGKAQGGDNPSVFGSFLKWGSQRVNTVA
jgi:hypothetical protein